MLPVQAGFPGRPRESAGSEAALTIQASQEEGQARPQAPLAGVGGGHGALTQPLRLQDMGHRSKGNPHGAQHVNPQLCAATLGQPGSRHGPWA